MKADPACADCGGTGEVFGHVETCDDDLCALNGDMHSCAGQVERCGCTNPAARRAQPEQGADHG